MNRPADAALGGVERFVGALEERLRACAVGRGKRYADTGARKYLNAFNQERNIEASDNPASQIGGVAGACRLRHDDGKLVAAQSGHQIAIPYAGLDALADLDQELIANDVPKPVVDILEVVEIEIENCKSLVQPDRSRERAFKTFEEGQPVRQVGQFVQPDLSLGPNLLGDPSGNLRGMNEHASQQHADVTDHQNRDEHIGRIAAASDRYRGASHDRYGECYRGGRKTGEGERTAAQHTRAEAGDNDLAAGRSVCKEQQRERGPHAA